MRLNSLIIFLLLSGSVSAQVSVRGRLLSKTDSIPVYGALILDSLGHQTLTDTNGIFTLRTQLPAKLEYLHINHTGYLLIPDTIFRDYVITDNDYRLQTAIIRRYNQIKFNRDFVYNPPVDTSLILHDRWHLETVDRTPKTDGIELGSPITYLYNRYSKEAKRRMAYADLMMKRNRVDRLRAMLNQPRLLALLGTEDTTQLTCFFLFCSLDPLLTEYLNEAQILEQARACALEYEHVAPCGYDTDLYFVR